MPDIKSSELLLEQVSALIENTTDVIAESEYAFLLKAPTGGFGEKAILAASGETLAERKERCLDIIAHLERAGMPVTIWHELLDTNGAVIIDKLNGRQIQIFQDYEPSS